MNLFVEYCVLLLGWGAACAFQDMQRKAIGNGLTLTAFAFALLHLMLTDQTLLGSTPGDAAVALIYILLLTLPGYALSRLGAGDVKMLSAIAVASNSSFALICFIVAGISMAIWYSARSHYTKLPWSFRFRFPLMVPQQKQSLPFAPFIFTGMLAAALWTNCA